MNNPTEADKAQRERWFRVLERLINARGWTATGRVITQKEGQEAIDGLAQMFDASDTRIAELEAAIRKAKELIDAAWRNAKTETATAILREIREALRFCSCTCSRIAETICRTHGAKE